jgi:hypothetical protein
MTANISSETPLTLDSIPAETFLTRLKVAQAQNACGVPCSPKTLASDASRGGGPPYHRFGRIVLYRWGDVVHWAVAKLGAPAATSSEHRVSAE